MANFGGMIRFTIAGTPMVLRGKIDIRPTSAEKKEITNNDGSVSYSYTNMAREADIIFEDGLAMDWEALMQADPTNITIIEDKAKMMHLFTDAAFSGRPQIDRNDGQVTGVKVTSSKYQRVSN